MVPPRREVATPMSSDRGGHADGMKLRVTPASTAAPLLRHLRAAETPSSAVSGRLELSVERSCDADLIVERIPTI
jgi:hypothetical protein